MADQTDKGLAISAIPKHVRSNAHNRYPFCRSLA
jgi:hypothetical protein